MAINKIKLSLFIFIFSSLSSALIAQKKQTKGEQNVYSKQNEFIRYNGIYESAMRINDFNVATFATYEMISLVPERSDLNDTLAMLYYAQNAYQQAIIIGEDVLKLNPEKRAMRELVAMAYDNLGIFDKAKFNYKVLYTNHGELYYLYKLATLEFMMKQFDDCMLSLNKLIQDPKAVIETITISLSQQSSESQQIPIAAAAYNIKGFIAMEQNKFTEAKANYDKALEIFPQFKMVQSNLENLRKKQNSIQSTQ